MCQLGVVGYEIDSKYRVNSNRNDQKSRLVKGLSFYHEAAFKRFYCKLFYDIQLGSANPTPSLIIYLVPFNSHAICTPSRGLRPLYWLRFLAQVHSVQMWHNDVITLLYKFPIFFTFLNNNIGVTQGSFGRLTIVTMLNLTIEVKQPAIFSQLDYCKSERPLSNE